MRKFVLLVVAALGFHSADARELCADWERRIEPDMQMEESAFTLEAAEAALERLDTLIREPEQELSWIAEGNSMKVVRGWLLKKAALEAMDEQQASDELPEVRRFCEFLVSEAFYFD